MALRVGFIGCGTIARGTLRLLSSTDDIAVVGALVRNTTRAAPLPLVGSLEALLALRPDVVVEAAGHEALRCHGSRVLGSGVDLLVLSVGALADAQLEAEL